MPCNTVVLILFISPCLIFKIMHNIDLIAVLFVALKKIVLGFEKDTQY